MSTEIPFNKPYLSGKESEYITDAIQRGKISGNGHYTGKCHQFFEERYGFKKCLLTTSCTDALEMAALLLYIRPGDEVIMPSYTFVSTANAFVLRGARIVFADSLPDHPNLDVGLVESLITPKTRAIVPVHYAGMAVDMDPLMEIAEKYHLLVVEDAAHGIDSFYKGRPLGGIGHLAAFSFHETKNLISGEGGMLVINDPQFIRRAEILWEKGTNRAAFFRGEVDKYNWVDIGSSYLPSEITAAFLYAQLENLDTIQSRRKAVWDAYYSAFSTQANRGLFTLPLMPGYATNNGHLFYLTFRTGELRDDFITRCKEAGIGAVFHYQSLHQSPYYQDKHDGRELPRSTFLSDTLVRLPLYYEIPENTVIEKVSRILSEMAGR
jgi:dTDP-4-amino-4,6-dideoxygalactose transaminase